MQKWLWSIIFVLIPLLGHSQVHRAYTRPEAVKSYLLKGGVLYSSFTGSSYQPSFSIGWQAGVAMKLPLLYRWWLQPELLYSSNRATLSYPADGTRKAYETTYSFDFAELPILLSYRANDIFEVQAGPYVGLLMDDNISSATNPAVSRLTPNELQKWNYGLSAGLEINMSPLAFGARYSYSILKLEEKQIASSYLGGASLHGMQVYGALVF
jgi:hypothetical protein